MNSFWKNVTSVFAGVFIAQLIPIIGSLFIARIFIPEVFGDFSVWLANTTILATLLTLRFETALAIVEDGEKRVKAVFYTFGISLLISLILGISLLPLLLINRFVPLPFSINTTSFLLSIMGALALALNQIWQSWAAAEGFYKKLTAMRLVQAVFLVVLQILLGLQAPNTMSLMAGFTISGLLSFLMILILMPNIFKMHFIQKDGFRVF